MEGIRDLTRQQLVDVCKALERHVRGACEWLAQAADATMADADEEDAAQQQMEVRVQQPSACMRPFAHGAHSFSLHAPMAHGPVLRVHDQLSANRKQPSQSVGTRRVTCCNGKGKSQKSGMRPTRDKHAHA